MDDQEECDLVWPCHSLSALTKPAWKDADVKRTKPSSSRTVEPHPPVSVKETDSALLLGAYGDLARIFITELSFNFNSGDLYFHLDPTLQRKSLSESAGIVAYCYGNSRMFLKRLSGRTTNIKGK